MSVIATNVFLGRERRKPRILGTVFRMVDKAGMREDARRALDELGIGTLQDITQPVEALSGGRRQAVAVAQAATFTSKVVILDEPTAALGVRESGQSLQLIRDLRKRDLPVILISHNMPNGLRSRGPHPHPTAGPASRDCDPVLAHDVRGPNARRRIPRDRPRPQASCAVTATARPSRC